MRLVTFAGPEGATLRLGLRVDSGVLDVAAAAEALGHLPGSFDPMAVIRRGPAGLAAVRAVAAAVGTEGHILDPGRLRYGPCVPAPGKIVGVGLNYRRHAEEANVAVPDSPVLFAKYGNALAGPDDAVAIPPEALQVDHEVELAVVIGKRARHVPIGSAMSHVLGYATANDLSARDLQFRTGQWLLGKSLDGFLPLGPDLVSADEIPDPGRLRLRAWVNGDLRQDASTADMLAPVDRLVSYISEFITLEAGDVILTGTPEGVIFGRPDPVWIRPGDCVEVEVEGLGRQTTTFVDGATSPGATL
jgi:2-keto-4-pentenoate hydratase/2-oxohepta-3-ene-1,7-dioic acid hydratase in catechol pathway